MTAEQITFITFGGLLILALAFDLGLLSKKTSHVTIKKEYLFRTSKAYQLLRSVFKFIKTFNRQIHAGKVITFGLIYLVP